MSTERAPGDLHLVEEFVNTRDEPDDASEFLTSPDHLGRWLRHRGLLEVGERITAAAELQRAIALREALRDLMAAHHEGVPAPAEAVATLAAEAERLPLTIAFAPDGSARLEPAVAGLDGAIARLLVVVFAAMREGTWERMKVCRSDTCIGAFFDCSRNRSGRFCCQGCRNVTKVRRHRARQRAAPSAPGDVVT